MAGVSLSGLTKRFETRRGAAAAVDALDLEIPDGAFVALLGPSGCGKTTVLRLIAGFERPSAGEIRFDGRLMSGAGTHVPPERRRIGMVFQSYALWPHMTVADNVGYPLAVRRVPRPERARRVAEARETVGLSDLSDRRPAALSGGQRQRVALARCLVVQPSVVLLDEPLANLDVHLRDSLEAEFRAFHARTGATMVYVTHDQREAMALADTVVVMEGGRLQQAGPPRRLYAEPASAMVARFIGQGMVVPGRDPAPAAPGCVAVSLFGRRVVVRGTVAAGAAGPAAVAVRMEDLRLCPDGEGIAAVVEAVTFQGARTVLAVRPVADPGHVLRVAATGETPPAPGATVGVAIAGGWALPPAG